MKKQEKCNQLLSDLDKMTVERPNILELKKHFLQNLKQKEPLYPVPNEPYLSHIKNTSELLKEINMNATLVRIQDFKNAAKCSAWFYKLLEDMLLKHIDKCPLTMFMAGKMLYLTVQTK